MGHGGGSVELVRGMSDWRGDIPARLTDWGGRLGGSDAEWYAVCVEVGSEEDDAMSAGSLDHCMAWAGAGSRLCIYADIASQKARVRVLGTRRCSRFYQEPALSGLWGPPLTRPNPRVSVTQALQNIARCNGATHT